MQNSENPEAPDIVGETKLTDSLIVENVNEPVIDKLVVILELEICSDFEWERDE